MFPLSTICRKRLKAFLVSKKVEFEKVHGLEYLVKLCTDNDDSFDWIYGVAKKLSEYAIEIRYPDEFYIPSVEEAKECFDTATKVKYFLFEKLGVMEEDFK